MASWTLVQALPSILSLVVIRGAENEEPSPAHLSKTNVQIWSDLHQPRSVGSGRSGLLLNGGVERATRCGRTSKAHQL